MWEVTFKLFKFLFDIMLIFIGVIAVVIFPFVVSMAINYIKMYKNGNRLKKSEFKKTEIKKSVLSRLLIDFPKRLVQDMYNKDPDEFREHGIVCVIGCQGSGKSITCIDYVNKLKQRYPNMQFLSNTPCTFADKLIDHPNDFIAKDNGKYGMLVLLDEAQNWFNSAESRNFPPEALSDICQERKKHKQILITTQRFKRLAAPIREQVSVYIKPITICGCLTVVFMYRPKLKDFDAEIDDLRKFKTYFFVHSDFERGAFDTFKTIEYISMKGWKDRSQHITASDTINVDK